MPPTTTTIPPTSTTPAADPVAAFRARKRAEREEKVQHELEARVLNHRWPISRGLRSELITAALRLCGLKISDDGQVQPTGEPPEPPRVRLAALRVLASYDKLSIDQRKLDLRQYPPTGEKPLPAECQERRVELSPEVATEILKIGCESAPPGKYGPGSARRFAAGPEPPPERNLRDELVDTRWPIPLNVRAALIETAAGLCGLSSKGAPRVEETDATEDPSQAKRMMLGALRVFARFDRLSLEHRRVELRYRQPASERKGPQFDAATWARIDALVDAEERRQIEQELAAEEAARAGPDA
jgi:hypothetical protein